MSKKTPNQLLISLITAVTLTAAGSTIFLSMSTSQYLASIFSSGTTQTATTTQPVLTNNAEKPLFSLYGENKPDTQEELCALLTSRLNDPNIVSPRAKHRYQTDYDLHCQDNQTLHSAADFTLSPEQMHGFLRNATSGTEALLQNNSILSLFDNYTPNYNPVVLPN